MPNHGTLNVEISLAKGIIFTKIGLANGTILKLGAAHPYRNLAKNPPPPPCTKGCRKIVNAVKSLRCVKQCDGPNLRKVVQFASQPIKT